MDPRAHRQMEHRENARDERLPRPAPRIFPPPTRKPTRPSGKLSYMTTHFSQVLSEAGGGFLRSIPK